MSNYITLRDIASGVAGVVGVGLLAATLTYNPPTLGGKARAAAEQKLSYVAMIPVQINAQHWRQYARQELADAGIDLKVTGADPLYQLEHIAENANLHRPWERSGEYHVPDVSGDGTFGGLPSR